MIKLCFLTLLGQKISVTVYDDMRTLLLTISRNAGAGRSSFCGSAIICKPFPKITLQHPKIMSCRRDIVLPLKKRHVLVWLQLHFQNLWSSQQALSGRVAQEDQTITMYTCIVVENSIFVENAIKKGSEGHRRYFSLYEENGSISGLLKRIGGLAEFLCPPSKQALHSWKSSWWSYHSPGDL